VALLATSVHTENFTSAGGGFMPYGWKGVFLALASGGVIFAYLGFEQAVQLGGESRNPGRNIPLAIIGGMAVAIVLYIALQVAFIAALDPSNLSKGWNAVSFSGKGQAFGPFAGLATALGLGWLAVLLYSAAIVLYATGSGIPFYGTRRTRFKYVVTSGSDDGGRMVDVPWDASALVPGDYVLRVIVKDAAGNEAIAGRDVKILRP